MGEAVLESVRGMDWAGRTRTGGQWGGAEQALDLPTVTGPSLSERGEI